MNDCLLEIKNLDVIYQTDKETVNAVNNINFTVNKKENLGLVGETGAGKTTTALSIMGLLPKNTGKIKNGKIVFNNINLLQLKEADMRAIRGGGIAMIFQDPMTSLNPVITVGKQIKEVLELHNNGKRTKWEMEDRVDEMLNMVGIPQKRKNEYPHQFSGGMRQRVVIAIALACEPDLLIADEPTTALDVTIQAQILDIIEDLKQKLDTSMIMITHDLGVIARTCDKVGIMYAGEIIEYGTTQDIFMANFHHPYTIGLFDSIPNIKDKTKRLKPIPGLMPDPTNLPKGCKFHPRCPQCMDICKIENPDNFIDGMHLVKCHLFSKQ